MESQEYVESEGYELVGYDGKKHFIWAYTDQQAVKDGIRWGYRHKGLVKCSRLVLNDEREGCWDRATQLPLTLPAYS